MASQSEKRRRDREVRPYSRYNEEQKDKKKQRKLEEFKKK